MPDKMLTCEAYQDFLLRWQHVHPDTRLKGRAGLRKVLRQLQGYGTYPLLWKRDILPARLERFDPAVLKSLIDARAFLFGRFCLTGQANHAPGAGTVFCEPAAMGHLLESHEPVRHVERYEDIQGEGWRAGARRLRHDCATVYNAIVGNSGATLDQIVGASGFAVRRAEKAIWQLYCDGSITNEIVECLFYSTLANFITSPAPYADYGLWADQGRWISCVALRNSVLPTIPRAQDIAAQRILQALRLYGIASLPLLSRHFSGVYAQVSGRSRPVSTSSLRPACDELVARGKAVKGSFVRDLSGDQYALPGAAEQAKGVRPRDEEPMVMLSSLDPACLYVSMLPVPSLNAYCFPNRFLVLHHGRLIAAIDCRPGDTDTLRIASFHLIDQACDLGLLKDAVTDFARRARLELPALPIRAAARPRTGRLDKIQRALSDAAGQPMKRQRNRGRTVLRYLGKVLLNHTDGHDPALVSCSVTRQGTALQKEHFAAIPKPLRPHARMRTDKYAIHVEVRVSPKVELSSSAFKELVQLWVSHVARQAREASQRRAEFLRRDRRTQNGPS